MCSSLQKCVHLCDPKKKRGEVRGGAGKDRGRQREWQVERVAGRESGR